MIKGGSSSPTTTGPSSRRRPTTSATTSRSWRAGPATSSSRRGRPDPGRVSAGPQLRAHQREAAVHDDGGARGVGALLRGEKGDEVRDLARVARPSEGDVRALYR